MSTEERPPRTRKELYERIARGGRDEVTLEEMIRLGFWEESRPLSVDVESEARAKELQARLRKLRESIDSSGETLDNSM